MGVKVHTNDEDENEWKSSDNKYRDRLLRDVFAKRPNYLYPMIPPRRSPEIASLLCMPKNVMSSKLQIFLSNMSLVGSLMLAGIIKVALEPDDANNVNETYKENLVNINNFLSSIIVVINVSIVLFVTYLFIQLTMDCDENILRVVSHAGGLVYVQFFAFLSGFLVLMKMVMANYIYSSGNWKYTGVIVITLLFNVAWIHFFFTVGRMFPYSNGRWARIFFPPLFMIRPDLEDSMDRVIHVMAQTAQENFNDITDIVENKHIKEMNITSLSSSSSSSASPSSSSSSSSPSSSSYSSSNMHLLIPPNDSTVKTSSILDTRAENFSKLLNQVLVNSNEQRCCHIAQVLWNEQDLGENAQILFSRHKRNCDKQMLLVALKGELGKSKLKLTMGERIALSMCDLQ